MLLSAWRKFKGWKVLEYFLQDNTKAYIREVAKRLDISPMTALLYLNIYHKEGLLDKSIVGNTSLYSLADNAATRELKKAYFLLSASHELIGFAKENEDIASLILYGSHAKGDYDRCSDVDLLVIAQRKELNLEKLKLLEGRLGKEVKVQVYPIGKWREKADKNDPFYASVIRNRVVIYGADI
ncbi:MAG: nucleotidyltransferase domain-containing protein [Candidatus Micrarchaeota archaeon]|nr:nucleotidyltransferase domain-containing protein [Candidatus Micrarchaeota archaeon]